MKRVSLLSLLLLPINFVTASNKYYGGSFSDLLDSIDPSLITLGAILVISFSILFFSLSKMFKNKEDSNKAIAAVISFALALLITYGANKSGLDFEGFFYGLGFSDDAFSIVMPLILIGGVIFMIVKFKWKAVVLVGVLLVVSSFTDYVYEKGALLIIGIIIGGIGIWMVYKGSQEKKKRIYPPYLRY